MAPSNPSALEHGPRAAARVTAETCSLPMPLVSGCIFLPRVSARPDLAAVSRATELPYFSAEPSYTQTYIHVLHALNQ